MAISYLCVSAVSPWPSYFTSLPWKMHRRGQHTLERQRGCVPKAQHPTKSRDTRTMTLTQQSTAPAEGTWPTTCMGWQSPHVNLCAPFCWSPFPAWRAATETATLSRVIQVLCFVCVCLCPYRYRIADERSLNALFSDRENGNSPVQKRNQGVSPGEGLGFVHCSLGRGDLDWLQTWAPHACRGIRCWAYFSCPGKHCELLMQPPALVCCRGPS